MMNVLGMVIPWWGRWLVLAAMVVSAGITGYVKGSASVQREWELSDAKLAAASSKVQIEALAKARSVEKVNAELNVRLEAEHHANQNIIKSRETDNRRLAAELGRMRLDASSSRSADGVPGSSNSTASSNGNTSPCGYVIEACSRFAKTATGIAADGDKAAIQARTGHDWAIGLK